MRQELIKATQKKGQTCDEDLLLHKSSFDILASTIAPPSLVKYTHSPKLTLEKPVLFLF